MLSIGRLAGDRNTARKVAGSEKFDQFSGQQHLQCHLLPHCERLLAHCDASCASVALTAERTEWSRQPRRVDLLAYRNLEEIRRWRFEPRASGVDLAARQFAQGGQRQQHRRGGGRERVARADRDQQGR